MNLLIASLADRPDLGAIFDDFPDSWPEFMYHDVVSATQFDQLLAAHPESNLIAIDPADPARPVARACAVPFSWSGDLAAEPPDRLPAAGYDQVILDGTADLAAGRRRGKIAAALEITIRPDHRGRGLSHRMLDELRRALARLGYTDLVAPVRPNAKHEHPTESMAQYLHRVRPDGLPADPWLRTHVRAGATLAGIAPASMTVAAPLEHWRRWTGLPFDVSGPVIVPEALVPVHCDLAQDLATYVEPNVWLHHRLAEDPAVD